MLSVELRIKDVHYVHCFIPRVALQALKAHSHALNCCCIGLTESAIIELVDSIIESVDSNVGIARTCNI